jgi:uncharacterized membrane protein YeaQ/YmgE (transglycosylase-associated protein family)
MSMGIWFVTGLVVGFLASKLIVRSGHGLVRDLGLGVAGAVPAGLIFGAVTTTTPAANGMDVFGLVVTIAGAIAALITYHTLFPHVRPR